jgi:hypothetical protein
MDLSRVESMGIQGRDELDIRDGLRMGQGRRGQEEERRYCYRIELHCTVRVRSSGKYYYRMDIMSFEVYAKVRGNVVYIIETELKRRPLDPPARAPYRTPQPTSQMTGMGKSHM